MKKLVRCLAASLMLVGVGVLVGCDKMTPDQIRLVANTVGTAAAYGWVSYDNPTEKQKTEVKDVLVFLNDRIGIVGTNKYVDVYYPMVQEYVNTSDKIPVADKPFVINGGLAVLSGIDMLFAKHPDWKADTQNVGSYVKSFIGGALVVLNLPCDDCQIVEATKHYKLRSAARK